MLQNKSDLEIFNSFIAEYGNNENCEHFDKTITFVSFEQFPFSSQNKYDSPFETCLNHIACSIDICSALDFSKKEMYAMISHEIGHIIFKTIEIDDDVIDREIKADSMAIQFNLKNELSSALQKMIDSGEYEDVKDDLYKRIEHLS